MLLSDSFSCGQNRLNVLSTVSSSNGLGSAELIESISLRVPAESFDPGPLAPAPIKVLVLHLGQDAGSGPHVGAGLGEETVEVAGHVHIEGPARDGRTPGLLRHWFIDHVDAEQGAFLGPVVEVDAGVDIAVDNSLAPLGQVES